MLPLKNKSISLLKRRRFLKAGILSSTSLIIGRSFLSSFKGAILNTKPEILHTNLCDLLGIKYPIIQAGMGSVATPELAAKVSEAGGLGIIGAALATPDELRDRIKRTRELTKKPFGVNLLLHEGIVHPIDIHKIPEEQKKEVQKVLNKFRDELNIPERHGEPEEVPETVNAAFEVLLEENVPVWSIGLGKPTIQQVKRCHDKGIKIIAMIATVENAIEVAQTGVDVIIAQGSEAGGHRSTWLKRNSNEDACIGAMALVPQVVEAVKQPVVAAGGITNGRGLSAALALGASGVLVGTRFVATKESGAPDFHKQAILKTSSDNTRITDKFSGSYARVIRNSFVERYEKETSAVLPPWVHYLTAEDIYQAARKNKKAEYYTLWAGQGAAQIKNIPSADEVVSSMVNEAIENIQKLMKYR